MPETLTTPQQLQRAPERKRGDIAERVWDTVNQSVHERLSAAHRRLTDSGEQFDNADLAQSAYADQERMLDETDTEEMTTTELTSQRIALMLLEMPFAAEGHAAVERGNFSSARQRLEAVVPITQFNHDFAAALDYMPKSMLPHFPEQAWRRAEALCRKLRLPVLPRARYQQIVQGMSKEVAVARAFHAEAPEGWSLEQSDVLKDIEQGVDLTVTNGDEQLDIDVKAGGSFQQTLLRLQHDKTFTERDRALGIRDGYARVPTDRYNRLAGDKWIVNADHIGVISQFEYEDPEAVVALLERLFEEQKY